MNSSSTYVNEQLSSEAVEPQGSSTTKLIEDRQILWGNQKEADEHAEKILEDHGLVEFLCKDFFAFLNEGGELTREELKTLLDFDLSKFENNNEPQAEEAGQDLATLQAEETVQDLASVKPTEWKNEHDSALFDAQFEGPEEGNEDDGVTSREEQEEGEDPGALQELQLDLEMEDEEATVKDNYEDGKQLQSDERGEDQDMDDKLTLVEENARKEVFEDDKEMGECLKLLKRKSGVEPLSSPPPKRSKRLIKKPKRFIEEL